MINAVERSLGFYFVCNKSRVNEAQRELPKIEGVTLYHESRAVRRKDQTGNLGPVLGKLIGGIYTDDQVLARVQQEIERRRLGVSPVKTLDVTEKFGTRREYRRWLSTI